MKRHGVQHGSDEVNGPRSDLGPSVAKEAGAALAAEEERRSGFLLDLNRCVGCGACVLACRIENALPEGVIWRRILTLNQRRVVGGPTYHFSLACHHCDDPPCAKGCPSGALEKRPDGVVFLHEDLCLGCRYCEMACPFGAPSYDAERKVMTKCHLCAPRQDRGLPPACTQACPTGALRFAADIAAAPGLAPDMAAPPDLAPDMAAASGHAPDMAAAPRFAPDMAAVSPPFEAPERIPGFSDSGGVGPNLWMAPPQGGLRAPLFQELRELLWPGEEDSDG